MTELNPAVCLKIKEARRAAKLSQSVVAAEVGCKQSALSMFEQGDGTKLNDEVVERLAKKFGVDLTPPADPVTVSAPLPVVRLPLESSRGCCPNPHCPWNRPY